MADQAMVLVLRIRYCKLALLGPLFGVLPNSVGRTYIPQPRRAAFLARFLLQSNLVRAVKDLLVSWALRQLQAHSLLQLALCLDRFAALTTFGGHFGALL